MELNFFILYWYNNKTIPLLWNRIILTCGAYFLAAKDLIIFQLLSSIFLRVSQIECHNTRH